MAYHAGQDAVTRKARRDPEGKRLSGRAAGDERPRPAHEEVARLAYELHQKRGAVPGDDWSDWFQAETLLKNRKG